MKDLRIVPECYVDTKVAEIIGRSRYNHQHGCSDVANHLKNHLKDKMALGIVDEDQNKGFIAKYLLEFNFIIAENDLILKQHKSRMQFLILISPEIEKWLLQNANTVGVVPIDYDLKDNLLGFKKLTKRQNIDHNIGFHRFIKELIKREAPGIITLKKWIDAFTNETLVDLKKQ
jgi:hypothetical protein